MLSTIVYLLIIGIAKLCEKVSEKKQKDLNISTYAAVKSMFSGIFVLSCQLTIARLKSCVIQYAFHVQSLKSINHVLCQKLKNSAHLCVK